MTRIMLSAVAAMLLAACVGVGEPPKRPPALRPQIEAADRLIERSGNVRDIHQAKVFDAELLATIGVDKINTEHAEIVTIEGSLRVRERDFEDYYGDAERKDIAQLAQAHQERVKAISAVDMEGRGRAIAEERKRHQEEMKPVVARAQARKKWYETTLVFVDVSKSDKLDMKRLLTKKTVTVPVKVKAVELQEPQEMPAVDPAYDGLDGYRVTIERPKMPVRVRRLDCTAADVPDGCESKKK